MRGIVEFRFLTTTHLRKAAVLLLEVARRPPPAAGRPIRAHITKTPPGWSWSGPERAELAWSQPLQLAPARPGSFSAKSAWSQRFPTGVSCSSWSQRGVRRLGLESADFVGVSVESAVPGWSQRGVRCFGLESWSQRGVRRFRLESARGRRGVSCLWPVGRGAMGGAYYTPPRLRRTATMISSSRAEGRTETPQTRKMLAPVGPAFGPIDTHEGHQARSEKRGSRSFQIIIYLGAGTRT